MSHPKRDYRRSETLAAVQRHVAEHGGAVVLGWVRRSLHPWMDELIHHAAWRSPDGVIVDIVPDPYGGQWYPDPKSQTIKGNRGEPMLGPTKYIASQERAEHHARRLESCASQVGWDSGVDPHDRAEVDRTNYILRRAAETLGVDFVDIVPR